MAAEIERMEKEIAEKLSPSCQNDLVDSKDTFDRALANRNGQEQQEEEMNQVEETETTKIMIEPSTKSPPLTKMTETETVYHSHGILKKKLAKIEKMLKDALQKSPNHKDYLKLQKKRVEYIAALEEAEKEAKIVEENALVDQERNAEDALVKLHRRELRQLKKPD
jgi:hypothetical protein